MKTFVLSLLILCSLTGCIKTSEGEKMGTVIKLSKQGFYCKTWEAEIVRFGVSNSNGATQSFKFAIAEDSILLNEVRYSLENKQEVKIKYETRFGSMCASESNGNFLVEIKKIPSNITNDRLDVIEATQDKILKEIEALKVKK